MAIDMSTSYRAAVRTGLPHATIVVDRFHVVQLANKMLSTVRRRTTATLRGRRGRATDPEWRTRCRLLRSREDLAEKQFTKMRDALMDAGQIGMTLLTAWIAQGRLRDLLALARTGVDRERVGHLRWKFLTWCADSEVPEVCQLAVTLDCWWARDLGVHRDRPQQRHQRRRQPDDQAVRAENARLPEPTSGYAHAASPPAEPEDTSHHSTSLTQ
ncbi:transposase [Streptomyces scabiei]|uniref:transposase n=1 Tax=Streptomyces scabiei TaxID=1930 RepID=UPI0036EFAFDE